MLGFLNYMLSMRWVNLQSYMKAFTTNEHAFGVDKVLGSLVDFDYWLDCPPRSAHDDQVRLHQRLYELHCRRSAGGQEPYFYPVVAYNPWTDINQGGAALTRVVDACTKGNFVAVRIYPPTGFRPAGNETIPAATKKARPDLKKLDATLGAFFDKCAELRLPGIRARGAVEWAGQRARRFWWAERMGSAAQAVCIGVPCADRRLWAFRWWPGRRMDPGVRRSHQPPPADVALCRPRVWEELMCPDPPNSACSAARDWLGKAMRVPISGTNETVLDRTMFATDWLMLSQVKRWAEYPWLLHESLRSILAANDADVAKVFGGNAKKCFRL